MCTVVCSVCVRGKCRRQSKVYLLQYFGYMGTQNSNTSPTHIFFGLNKENMLQPHCHLLSSMIIYFVCFFWLIIIRVTLAVIIGSDVFDVGVNKLLYKSNIGPYL